MNPIKQIQGLFIASVFLLSAPALATKESGGGNVDPQGQLAEVAMDHQAKPLNRASIELMISKELSRLRSAIPGFADDLAQYQRSWFVTSQKFDQQACGFESPVDVEAHPAACQILTSGSTAEIYIDSGFWKSARLSDKRDLLMHEWIRTAQLAHGIEYELALYRAVLLVRGVTESATASQSESRVLQLRQALQAYGFGDYLTAQNVKALVRETQSAFASYCAAVSDRRDGRDFGDSIFHSEPGDEVQASFAALKSRNPVLSDLVLPLLTEENSALTRQVYCRLIPDLVDDRLLRYRGPLTGLLPR